MKILFFCRDTYAYDYSTYSGHLVEKYGVDCEAVVLSSKTARFLERNYPKSYSKIYNMDEYFYKNGDFASVSLEEKEAYLEDMAWRHDLPTTALSMYLDRHVRRYTHDDWITQAYGIGKYLEEIAGAEDFDIVISEMSTTYEIFFYHMARKRGIPHILPGSARFKGRMAFRMGLRGNAPGFTKTYDSYLSRDLTLEDIKQYKDAYEGLTEGKKKAEYSRKKRFLSNVLANVQYYLPRKRDRNLSRYTLEPTDYSSISWLIYLRLLKLWNTYLMYPLKKIFSPMPKHKYMYFPLHVDPEAATLLSAPFHVNQIALIENVAKSLPIDHVLVVKEHPYMYGHRACSFYEGIRQFPNVVLVHPLEDNFKILRNCSAVVTITGTAGFEAILMGKPVFVFGEVFYRNFRQVYPIDNIKDMAEIMRKGLREFRKDPDAIMKFALAYYKCTYDGVIITPVENPWVLASENVEKVAAAIYTVSQRLMKDKSWQEEPDG